jgi:hypothetical protein
VGCRGLQWAGTLVSSFSSEMLVVKVQRMGSRVHAMTTMSKKPSKTFWERAPKETLRFISPPA